MSFDPRVFRNKDGIGMPSDTAAVNATDDNTAVALLKGIWAKLNGGVSTETTQAAGNVLIGAVTETAPANDTASSGLNGRLQRVAQRITSLIALVPAALSGSGNFKVAVSEALPTGTNSIGTVSITDISNAEYETVAASQTAQVIGATGATGDYISHITVTPTTLSPGVVTLLDNATSIAVFAGGATSLSNLAPFTIVLGAKSTSGAWKLTTGAGLSCIAFGNFT
jgi:hypothetical protein